MYNLVLWTLPKERLIYQTSFSISVYIAFNELYRLQWETSYIFGYKWILSNKNRIFLNWNIHKCSLKLSTYSRTPSKIYTFIFFLLIIQNQGTNAQFADVACEKCPILSIWQYMLSLSIILTNFLFLIS